MVVQCANTECELYVTVHSAPFAKPSAEDFTATSWLSTASNASARRNAHILGALFVHSFRQIFMRDRKKPTGMYE